MFKKAERKRAFLKIAMTGPSGSGKTWSALAVASGFGGKVAVVDTENGSASLYSDKFDFDVVELKPPYTPLRYSEIIRAAEKANYNVLVIDSLSHVWAGEGGVIDKKETLDGRGGNQNTFANWRVPKAEHQKLKDLILHSQMHIISTLRSKQSYLQSADSNGKKKVEKVGLDPIAEPGIEYEYTTVLDLDMTHKAAASKDRTGLFDGEIFSPSKETGEKFINWLGGAPVKDVVPPLFKDDENSVTDPGDYVCRYGNRINNKKLREVPAEYLTTYLNWLTNDADPREREKEEAQELMFFGKLYFESLRSPPAPKWQDEEFPKNL